MLLSARLQCDGRRSRSRDLREAVGMEGEAANQGRAAVAAYAVWHPGCVLGSELSGRLFIELCADPRNPALRGMGIPVRFRTTSDGLDVPVGIPFGDAERTAVFVIADELLVADASWRDYTEGLVGAAGPGDRVIPVALVRPGLLPPKLAALQAIRLNGVPNDQLDASFGNDVLHDVSRMLDPGAAKVKVFLSHAKQDGVAITGIVRRHLHEVARLDDFFDAADIPDGSRFAEVVTQAAGSLPALLAIQTDTYASREWCRLEVLEAKRKRVPIVVVAAVEKGERRAFPYLGNVPVVRWHGEGSLSEVVGVLLREVLRSRYFPLRVEAICRLHHLNPNNQVFSYPPELLTALWCRGDLLEAQGASRGRLVYPDPPLGTEELELLRQLDQALDPVTPTLLRAL
jgi:hypothetical protein